MSNHNTEEQLHMPSILQRLTIDAPPERVHRLLATTEGIQQWWTARPVTGEDSGR